MRQNVAEVNADCKITPRWQAVAAINSATDTPPCLRHRSANKSALQFAVQLWTNPSQMPLQPTPPLCTLTANLTPANVPHSGSQKVGPSEAPCTASWLQKGWSTITESYCFSAPSSGSATVHWIPHVSRPADQSRAHCTTFWLPTCRSVSSNAGSWL
jgi:hypothetical protein